MDHYGKHQGGDPGQNVNGDARLNRRLAEAGVADTPAKPEGEDQHSVAANGKSQEDTLHRK
jgi:hypothetical protein